MSPVSREYRCVTRDVGMTYGECKGGIVREDRNLSMGPVTRNLSVGITMFLVLVLVATSCSRGEFTGSETREGGRTEETTAGGGKTAERTSSGPPTQASEALRNLSVSEPGSMSGYSRESFKHWSDAQERMAGTPLASPATLVTPP